MYRLAFLLILFSCSVSSPIASNEYRVNYTFIATPPFTIEYLDSQHVTEKIPGEPRDGFIKIKRTVTYFQPQTIRTTVRNIDHIHFIEIIVENKNFRYHKIHQNASELTLQFTID